MGGLAVRGAEREPYRSRQGISGRPAILAGMCEADAPDIQEPQSPAVAVTGSRHETDLERHDRNLNELLGELRVALPGVQVLFAFLLVAPFNQRFGTLSHFERRLYFVTLLCTLLASILLIAPTLVHRFHFRLGEKAYVVDTANRLMIAGLSVFAFAMTCAVLLITLYLFGPATAVVTTAIVIITFGLVWFALPLGRRRLHHGFWRRPRI
jgi:Family of unknown function (DUF6328)